MANLTFSTKRVLLSTAGAVALSIGAAGLAVAQTMPSQTQPAGAGQQVQGQQGQQPLTQAVSSLREASQRIESAPSNQLRQTAQQAMDPLQKLEQSLQSAGAVGGTQVQASLDSVKTARAALQEQQPDKQLIVRALNDVIEGARKVEQQMAQGQQGGGQGATSGQASAGQGSGAQIGVQQKSAQVDVQQSAPQVTVQQPAPQVTVQQPRPEVTVRQPNPEVTVQQARPEVTVNQTGEPKVTVQQQGEPQVNVQTQGDAATNRQTTQSSTSPGSTMQPATTAQTGTEPANQIAGMGRTLVGKEIYGANNRNIGDVEDVVVQNSQVQSVLVDVGGFLGIGARRVAIPITALSMQGDRLVSSMTDAQVRDLPEHRAAQ
jgi:sporulation protein YlmC with PRC-barrel domain